MKKVFSLCLTCLFLLITLPLGGGSAMAETVAMTVSQRGTSIDTVFEQVPDHLRDTQVRMLTWWAPEDIDNAKAAAFEDATGIQVAYDTVSINAYQTQQAINIAARKPSSIVAMLNEWYPRAMVNRMVQPLSNVTGWDFTDKTVYATSLMDQFAYKGERYGIALKGSIGNTFHMMFFNKRILAECGVNETPYDLWMVGKWNWDTCLAIAKQCTKPNDGLSGMTNVNLYAWMLSAGQDFVQSTPDGLVNCCDSAELLDAWKWSWDLINTYKVVDTSYTGQIPFYQGKAAMLGAGSYMMMADPDRTGYVPQNMTDDWGVVPFPSPEGMNVSACDGTVWGFSTGVRGSELQAAAWYLRYYLDDVHNPLMADTFPADHPECWEVLNWMWEQPMQSYNSAGVLTTDGEYTPYSVQYSLNDEAFNKLYVERNLAHWSPIFESKISKLYNQEGHTCIYSYICDEYCDDCGIGREVYHTYDGPMDSSCNVCGQLRGDVPFGGNLVPNSGFENGLEGWQEWGKNGTYEDGANYSAKVLNVENSADGKVLEFKLNYTYNANGQLVMGSDWCGIHLDGIDVKPNTRYQLKVVYKIAPDALFASDESDGMNRMTGYLFVRGIGADGYGSGLGDIYDDSIGSLYMLNGSKNEWREDTVTFQTYDSGKLGLDLRAVAWLGVPTHYYIDSLSLFELMPEIPNGDINGNGYVTLRDGALLQRYLNGWNVNVYLPACDLNQDGAINSKDLVLLRRRLNGWEQ